MSLERLQKVLAAAGVASRRASETLIAAGRVTVDGHIATIGEQVDPDVATIAVDGRQIASRPAGLHLAMNKPIGVTSTVRDRHAEQTVMDLVPPEYRRAAGRLYPVGRLDRDSEGLLLLTNDGPWADAVLHPRHEVEREYAIGLSGAIDDEQRRALESGILLDEGMGYVSHLRGATSVETRRLADTLLPPPPRLVWYRGTLEQGWKRQLRRMFAAVDAPIVRLVRVRVGTVRLDDLRTGQVRPLTPGEIRSLGARRE